VNCVRLRRRPTQRTKLKRDLLLLRASEDRARQRSASFGTVAEAVLQEYKLVKLATGLCTPDDVAESVSRSAKKIGETDYWPQGERNEKICGSCDGFQKERGYHQD
jgi:hypothetical protein